MPRRDGGLWRRPLSPPLRDAAELARDFDRSFEEPARATEAVEAFLALTAGGLPYAIRLSQVRGLLDGRRIVAVPSPAPALLGIVSARAEILPVYDLARLLGGEAGSVQAACPWLLLVDAPAPAALAFSRFEGHARVPAAPVGSDLDGRRRATIQLAGHSRAVIDPAVLEAAIRRQTQTKET